MHRRPFLQLLAGLIHGIPTVTASASPSLGNLQNTSHPVVSAIFSPGDSLENFLLEWQRLPMQPIPTVEDIPKNVTPFEREIATSLLSVMREGVADFHFTYQGGSEPGTTRQVQPILLFQKFEFAYDLPERFHLYLLAFCQSRQAARTFRLDRIRSAAAIL